MSSPLHVVTMVSNPVRYRSRYELYFPFAKRVGQAGAPLTTVEVAYGDRPFMVTCRDNPDHVQLRSPDELWMKEAAINLGIAQVLQRNPNAQYIAWVDADVLFTRPDWVNETVQQLQHFDFVQMFSHAQDVGPRYEPLARHTGFAYAYWNGLLKGPAYSYASQGHPGYAWAARRDALDKVGGLIDFAVLGAADKHMAMALIGQVQESFKPANGGLTSPYVKELLRWQDRAERHIRRNMGYVDGTLIHHWHGRKASRKYIERWQILVDHQFDPDNDLRRDAQGLWRLNDTDDPRQRMLRDDIRRYFRARNEDGNEV